MLPSFGQNRTHTGIISNFYRKSSVSGEFVREISLKSFRRTASFLWEATEIPEKREISEFFSANCRNAADLLGLFNKKRIFFTQYG